MQGAASKLSNPELVFSLPLNIKQSKPLKVFKGQVWAHLWAKDGQLESDRQVLGGLSFAFLLFASNLVLLVFLGHNYCVEKEDTKTSI